MSRRSAIALLGALGLLGCGRHEPQLTRALLDASLEKGTQYLLTQQTRAGDFAYEYDFLRGKVRFGLSPTRQAGALWGLASLHRDRPTPETGHGVRRGLAFYEAHSRLTATGARYFVYPGMESGDTGAAALLTLAYLEFLRADPPATDRAQLKKTAHEFLAFLLSLRTPSGQFHLHFDHQAGRGFGEPSPYFDGEALLALTRAAKYHDQQHLVPLILESAETMHRIYIAQALKRDPDSPITKGFYQWSSMAFYEIHTAGWAADDRYARRTIDLAYWMIDVHETLQRSRNTGYAYEGLVSARELARLTGDHDACGKIAEVIDEGLGKLLTWQVGGPCPNWFLRRVTTPPQAVGGVMNGETDPVLRIDVTQHQMHAVQLARRFLFSVTN